MKPLPLETVPFDAAPYLTDEASQLALLADALESGESAYIAAAIGTIARARGMTDIARRSGVGRTALYRALSADSDPKLSTVVGVVKALGLKPSISADPAA